jgi:hypothetical protein
MAVSFFVKDFPENVLQKTERGHPFNVPKFP